MAVRSKLLFAGTVATSGTTVLYTTPSDHTTILQYLTLYSRGSDAGTCRLLVRSGGVSVGVLRSVKAALEWEHLDTWIVIGAGDQLLCDGPTSGGAGWWITASGAELVGVPDALATELPELPVPEPPS